MNTMQCNDNEYSGKREFYTYGEFALQNSLSSVSDSSTGLASV